MTMRVWSLATGRQVLCVHTDIKYFTAICVTPDGQHVVISADDNIGISVWSLQTGRMVQYINEYAKSTNNICVTPDGKHIVCASTDSTLRVWSLQPAVEETTRNGLEQEVDMLYEAYKHHNNDNNTNDKKDDDDDDDELLTSMLGVVLQDTMLRLRVFVKSIQPM